MYFSEVTTGELHGSLSDWIDTADTNGTTRRAAIGKKRIVRWSVNDSADDVEEKLRSYEAGCNVRSFEAPGCPSYTLPPSRTIGQV